VTPPSSVLRRDGPSVDVLEGLATPLVRLGVRSAAARTVEEKAAPRAGFLSFDGRTIMGQPVTIAVLEHHAITDQGGERPVERSHRHARGRLDVGVGQRRHRRAPEDLGDLISIVYDRPFVQYANTSEKTLVGAGDALIMTPPQWAMVTPDSVIP
jgi:hypothetical protein